MSINLKQKFDRFSQNLSEKIMGNNDTTTKLDPDLAKTLESLDQFKTSLSTISNDIEAYLHISASKSMLPLVDKEKTASNKAEQIGSSLENLTLQAENKNGGQLQNLAEMFKKLGQLETDNNAEVQSKFTDGVKKFLNEDMKALDEERKTLNNYRLDMDACKSKVGKKPESEDSPEMKEMTKLVDAYTAQVQVVQEKTQSVQEEAEKVQNSLKDLVSVLKERANGSAAIFDDLLKSI